MLGSRATLERPPPGTRGDASNEDELVERNRKDSVKISVGCFSNRATEVLRGMPPRQLLTAGSAVAVQTSENVTRLPASHPLERNLISAWPSSPRLKHPTNRVAEPVAGRADRQKDGRHATPRRVAPDRAGPENRHSDRQSRPTQGFGPKPAHSFGSAGYSYLVGKEPVASTEVRQHPADRTNMPDGVGYREQKTRLHPGPALHALQECLRDTSRPSKSGRYCCSEQHQRRYQI